LVRRTIKVRKKPGRGDQAVPVDLLTRIIQFARTETKFLIGAAIAVCVVVIAIYMYKSHEAAELQRASILEYRATETFSKAQELYSDQEGQATSAAQIRKRREELLNKALSQFEKIVERYPSSKSVERAMFYIGCCYYELGKYRSALSAYEKYLHRFPKGHYAAFCLADIAKTQEQIGEDEAAAGTYERLFAKWKGAPGVQPYLLDLARLYQRLDRKEDAKRVYTQVASLYPGSKWERQANQALTRMDAEAKAKAKLSQAASKRKGLPPGFDASKVKRVVVKRSKKEGGKPSKAKKGLARKKASRKQKSKK